MNVIFNANRRLKMFERRRVLCRVIVMTIAFIVGCSMILGASTVKASAASKTPSKVTIYSYKSINYNTVVVKWRIVKGAKKYEVYRATSKNGKYKKVKTTTAKSFTNTGLTTGKNYYYKVRAVSKSGNKGKFSYKKVVMPKLNTPSLKIVDKGSSYVTVSYSKVNGATGYQLYRSTKYGSYVKVGSYKGLNVKDIDLMDNYEFYYKVRAYRKVGGKYVYSTFSSAKYVKTDKYVESHEESVHYHNWLNVDTQLVNDDTWYYTNDRNIYWTCNYCAYHYHLWVDVSDSEFCTSHMKAHAFAGEMDSGGWKTRQKNTTFVNLTEDDLKVKVFDQHVELTFKCTECGAEMQEIQSCERSPYVPWNTNTMNDSDEVYYKYYEGN